MTGLPASYNGSAEPQDFIARLAALVPRPNVHLVRYHGLLLRVWCPTPFRSAFGRQRGHDTYELDGSIEAGIRH
ncbi:MAG: hypothetical protein HOI95_00275 [Chromatiales bacterium]|nr:hypothetical protein [Chromatiales bacterium]